MIGERVLVPSPNWGMEQRWDFGSACQVSLSKSAAFQKLPCDTSIFTFLLDCMFLDGLAFAIQIAYWKRVLWWLLPGASNQSGGRGDKSNTQKRAPILYSFAFRLARRASHWGRAHVLLLFGLFAFPSLVLLFPLLLPPSPSISIWKSCFQQKTNLRLPGSKGGGKG